VGCDADGADLIEAGMAHKEKWSDLAFSVGLVLAVAAACVSTPTVRRTVQTFDVATFLVVINEAFLGIAPEGQDY